MGQVAKPKAGDVEAVEYVPYCETCGASSMWRYVVLVVGEDGKALVRVLRHSCNRCAPPKVRQWLQRR